MDQRIAPANIGKFIDPDKTLDGSTRASVALDRLETLWLNTGTLCNITCEGCYIESSPSNDRLAYLTLADAHSYFDEIKSLKLDVREIGFTGGEPFMNPDILPMLRDALSLGFEVLVLTNAMQPMMRPMVREGLAQLIKGFGARLTLRVSLDHWTQDGHDAVRGAKSFEKTLEGLRWLAEQKASIAIAGRARWDDSETAARQGYAALFAENALPIDADNPAQCVIFPEMDMSVEVPEITTECWDILGKSPKDVMCASSRMVVKPKGGAPNVIACTLLPYEAGFNLGPTLEGAAKRVALNHPHCAKFCVLGGASCSA
ncbi:MAG: radical SAM protein [Maritimibacter sp.]